MSILLVIPSSSLLLPSISQAHITSSYTIEMGSSHSTQAVLSERVSSTVTETPQITAKDVQTSTSSTQSGLETSCTGTSGEPQSKEPMGSPKQPSDKYKVHFPRWEGAVRDSEPVASNTSVVTPNPSVDGKSDRRAATPGEGGLETACEPRSQSSTGSRNTAESGHKEGDERMANPSSEIGGIVDKGAPGLDRTGNVDREDHEEHEAEEADGSDDSGEDTDDSDFPVWTGPRPCCHSHCVPRQK
ncbi:unnamed protein product [Cyclocybe aegerita]|uniref:Uncharacterized protein n=1 Tax=Cyclocybe aegerita TaxID=1973307 RepID=A0A8S0WJ29_CYCAE|nr:unnamed protein product [Cyclocybe aegerita]